MGEKLENIFLKIEGQVFLKGIANKVIDGSCLLFNGYNPEASSTQALRIPVRDSVPVSHSE